MLWTAEARYKVWEWLAARWPDARDWDEATVRAFFTDLERYPSHLVQRALERLRDQGREFAPRVSLVISTVRDLAIEEPPGAHPALPPPPLPGQMSWAEYAHSCLGHNITLREAARLYARGELVLGEE